MTELGRVMNMQAFALTGSMDAACWAELLEEITVAIGMEVVADPAVWNYPTEDGKGGDGATMTLPITTSFMTLDTWSKHNGAYLVIASCRPFDVADIRRVLLAYRLKICGAAAHTLRIEDDEL